MGRIAETILSSDLPGGLTEAITQATSWAEKGLDIVMATRQSHPNIKHDECELAYITLLFSVGTMRQVSFFLRTLIVSILLIVSF